MWTVGSGECVVGLFSMHMYVQSAVVVWCAPRLWSSLVPLERLMSPYVMLLGYQT